MGEETEQINIVIPKSMKKWLDDNKKIVPNKSKLFREAVYNKMESKKGKVPALVFFVSIMGMVFSIVLIGIGLTPSPMHVTLKSILPLLGGILVVSTSIMYYIEKRRAKEEINA